MSEIKTGYIRDVSNWQTLFTDTVTETAFALTLSKRMTFILLSISYHNGFPLDVNCRRSVDYSHWVSTAHSLINRGLISHENMTWKVTPAGKAVVELLKLAGMEHRCRK